MNEATSLFFGFFSGVFLGALFFGGLWWTVQRGIKSNGAALWFGLSMILRTAIVLFGFYYVGRENWQRLLICLLGFTFARIIVHHLTRLPRRIYES